MVSDIAESIPMEASRMMASNCEISSGKTSGVRTSEITTRGLSCVVSLDHSQDNWFGWAYPENAERRTHAGSIRSVLS